MARILVLADDLPFPTVGGGRLRVWAVLTRLAAHNEVALLCNDRHGDAEVATKELRLHKIETHVVARSASRPWTQKAGEVLPYLPTRIPPAFGLFTSAEYRRLFRRVVAQFRPTVVVIEEESLAIPLGGRLRSGHNAPAIVVDLSNLYSRSFYKRPEGSREGVLEKLVRVLTSRRLARFEAQLFAGASLVACCSQLDAADAKRLGAIRIVMAPNGVDVEKIKPLERPARPTIGYIGTLSSDPNTKAATELIERVLPLVRGEIPECGVVVAGRGPKAELLALAAPGSGVSIMDSPPEVVRFYEESSVIVVPLREGGGTRVKILEAMAYGRPVVSTAMGAEGIETDREQPFVVAETPAELAAAAARILKDPAEWERRAEMGRQLMESRYGWDTTLRAFVSATSALTTP